MRLLIRVFLLTPISGISALKEAIFCQKIASNSLSVEDYTQLVAGSFDSLEKTFCDCVINIILEAGTNGSGGNTCQKYSASDCYGA